MQPQKLSAENAEKLKRIYLKYRHFLYRNAAFPVLKEHALSEDAVQETFEKISRYLDKIDEAEERSTKAFLLVTCKHVAIDIYNRKMKLNFNADLADEIETEEAPDSDILEKCVHKETRETIINKVKTLDPRYQTVFFLRYGKDFSYDTIGELLDIEPATARKRIERVRAKLFASLRKEDDE